MFKATFILSTGRCGTQWLHARLKQRLTCRVSHEPLHNRYRPRIALGRKPSPVAVRHLAMIRDILKETDYIECGHPCWSSLPWLSRELAGQIRIIHLTRHPVETAYSWLSHGAYIPPLLPHLKEKILISPWDENVLFPEYAERWDTLTPYEKCLYYWLEVHAHAMTWQGELKVPWLRMASEKIFQEEGLERLFAFLGHEPGPLAADLFTKRIDRHHGLAMAWAPPELIQNHPPVLDLATQLGYDPLEIGVEKILNRYYCPAAALKT